MHVMNHVEVAARLGAWPQTHDIHGSAAVHGRHAYRVRGSRPRRAPRGTPGRTTAAVDATRYDEVKASQVSDSAESPRQTAHSVDAAVNGLESHRHRAGIRAAWR